MKGEYTTETGFDVRITARLKNAKLIGAREMSGLTARAAAKDIGISYVYYLHIESMRHYPGKETQKKICDFYRSLGIFLLEEEVFPEELRKAKPRRKYEDERTIELPKLLPLPEVDESLLPAVSGYGKDLALCHESQPNLDEALSRLTFRERQVIMMRYGIGTESRTQEEIAKVLNVCPETVRNNEKRALKKLGSRYTTIKRILKDYAEDVLDIPVPED